MVNMVERILAEIVNQFVIIKLGRIHIFFVRPTKFSITYYNLCE